MENKKVLKVVFRKFNDGEVIALFPEFTNKRNYTIDSYMHVGQHGECDPLIVNDTKLATEEEYKTLLNEIKSIYHDYDIKVMKKLNIKW